MTIPTSRKPGVFNDFIIRRLALPRHLHLKACRYLHGNVSPKVARYLQSAGESLLQVLDFRLDFGRVAYGLGNFLAHELSVAAAKFMGCVLDLLLRHSQ